MYTQFEIVIFNAHHNRIHIDLIGENLSKKKKNNNNNNNKKRAIENVV